MISKLIIHPGIGKTGTSAIQQELFALDDVDADVAVKYPKVGLDDKNAHHFFADNYPGYSKGNLDVILEKLNCIVRDHSRRFTNMTYVISSEFLIYSSSEHIDFLIKHFKTLFNKVEVIFVVRNYTDLIYSSYLQAVKTRYGSINGESIIDFTARMGDGFDFPKLIPRWKSCDEVYFIDYDSNKSNFIESFFDFLNIKYQNQDTEKKINTSLIEDLVSIVYQYDKGTHSSEERQRFIKNMVDFSYNYKDYSSKRMKSLLDDKYKLSYENDLKLLKANYIEVKNEGN